MRQERIEAIYNELGTLVVDLDADPVTRGPAYLQDLISKTRGYLNKTSLYIHEVHREAHVLQRDLDALEASYEISSAELLANDNRVTRLPNIDDRKAMIGLILRDEWVKIQALKRDVRELGFVEKAVKHRHKELDNTMSSIRMQKSLIDSEIRTGSFYGDENDASRKSQFRADDIDESELDRILGETAPAPVQAEESEAPQPVGDPPKEQPKTPESPQDEFARFLEEDDFSDILDNV